MKDKIRIASGQGFWGDLLIAPVEQVRKGPVDYLVMDYLAEVTMSILQKQKLKNPSAGYARDFPEVIREILPDIKSKKIKVISNAGGVNPTACRDKITEYARQAGISGLSVAVITGDDILSRLDEMIGSGIALKNMDNGKSLSAVREKVVSANVYFGAAPIVEALRQGADIIITGRTTDTGLTLAPMIHEFGWSLENWDKLAAGTVAGHILECGAQSSGGNFTDWRKVKDFVNIGFPICEACPDGSFYITKHEKSGGYVHSMTVKEQLLYEIADPAQYITPDCIADFTSIHLKDEGKNRVKVYGITGSPRTPFLKVSISYSDGWKAGTSLTYAWPEAKEKAEAAAKILKGRLDKLGLKFEEYRSELIGVNACHENTAPVPEGEINEVQLRVAVRGKDPASIERFGKEIAPLILTGPPSVTGFAGGRPAPSEIIAYWPALIPREAVKPEVSVVKI